MRGTDAAKAIEGMQNMGALEITAITVARKQENAILCVSIVFPCLSVALASTVTQFIGVRLVRDEPLITTSRWLLNRELRRRSVRERPRDAGERDGVTSGHGVLGE